MKHIRYTLIIVSILVSNSVTATIIGVAGVTEYSTFNNPASVGINTSVNIMSGSNVDVIIDSQYIYTLDNDGFVNIQFMTDSDPGELNLSITATNNTNLTWNSWAFIADDGFSFYSIGNLVWDEFSITSSQAGYAFSDINFPNLAEYIFDMPVNIGDTLTLSATLFYDPAMFVLGDGAFNVILGAGVDRSSLSTVPVPAAVWLFGSGLFGLVGVARRKKA